MGRQVENSYSRQSCWKKAEGRRQVVCDCSCPRWFFRQTEWIRRLLFGQGHQSGTFVYADMNLRCKSHVTFTMSTYTEVVFMSVPDDFWVAKSEDNSQSLLCLNSVILKPMPPVGGQQPPLSAKMMHQPHYLHSKNSSFIKVFRLWGVSQPIPGKKVTKASQPFGRMDSSHVCSPRRFSSCKGPRVLGVAQWSCTISSFRRWWRLGLHEGQGLSGVSHDALVAEPGCSRTRTWTWINAPSPSHTHFWSVSWEPGVVPGIRTMEANTSSLLWRCWVSASHIPKEGWLWFKPYGCQAFWKFFFKGTSVNSIAFKVSWAPDSRKRVRVQLAGTVPPWLAEECGQTGHVLSRWPGPLHSELGAIAKWTNICFSIPRKLKIKIDTCKMRLSCEPSATSNCNLSSGCCAYPERSRKRGLSRTCSGFLSAPSPRDGFWLLKWYYCRSLKN